MPHVASQAKSHALKHSQSHQSRAPAQDRSPGGAFESMLDDNASAAADRAAPRADTARTDRTAPAQKTSAPDKTAKPANTKDSAPAKTADNAQPDTEPVETAAKPAVDAKPDATAAKAEGDAQLADALTTTSDTDAPAETPAVTQPLADFVAMIAALETLPAGADQPETDAPAPVAIETAPVAATPDTTAVAAATNGTGPAPAAAPAQTLDVIAAVQETAAPDEAQPVAAEAPKVEAKKDGKDDKDGKTEVTLLKSDAKNDDELQPAKPQTEAKPQAETETKSETKPQQANAETDKSQAAPTHDKSAPAHHTRAEATPAPQADTTLAAPKTVEQAAQHVLPHALQGLTNSINTVATVATPQPADPATLQQAAIPLSSVAVEIASQALAGKNRFEIRLDPPELGRIDVRLDVDRDGNVTSRLVVDRQDTLDLLRRDASGLERALQDAGLKTSDNGLQFSLRDQQASGQEKRTFDDGALADEEVLPALDAGAQGYSRLTGRVGGLDIRV